MDTPIVGEPRVAIVADAMVTLGGGERVVEALAEAFPSAAIFAVMHDPSRTGAHLASRVRTSWLNGIPLARRYAKALLPFIPNAVESFDLRGFDVIVSSNHTLAKGILRSADQVHICYCHTPLRALWEQPHSELFRVPRVLRPLARGMLLNLRIWDYCAAARVDHFVANSVTTQRRIAAHYRRESTVLSPPIDVEAFRPGPESGEYYLVVSRNVPYKRIELAIEAAQRLGRRLVIAGEGTDKLPFAGALIERRGKVGAAELLRLMQGARALLAPQIEDFGMAILEMNACGKPVIAFAAGGALETVIDGKNGVLFSEQTTDALATAIMRFEQMPFDSAVVRREALNYSKESFMSRIRQMVYDVHEANRLSRRRASAALTSGLR